MRFELRLNETLKRALLELAQREGITWSEWVRRAIASAAGLERRPPE
jgi:predicted HicB family RNase H-like nuclease